MSLIDEIADDFERDVRDRGRSYFEHGAVEISRASERSIRAMVQGTDLYRVRISWKPEGWLDWDCSCPYFAEHDECKHIWATLLEADHKGMLPEELIENNGYDEEDDDEEDSDGNGDVDPVQQAVGFLNNLKSRGAGGANRAREQSTSQPKPKPPPWKQHIERIRESMKPRDPSGSAAVGRSWPANKRMAYLIDVPASVYQHDSLVIELGAQTQERAGVWSPPRRTRVTEGQVGAIPDPGDRLILQLLAGSGRESGYYRYVDTQLPSRYQLGERDFDVVLKRICEGGRCFAQTGENTTDPEPLMWDEEQPWELWLSLLPESGGERYRLEASLRRGEQRMAGDEPLLVLEGLILAHGKISRVEHFGAFEMLSYLRRHGPITLAVQQGDELLAELLSMSPLPKLDLPPELRVQEVRPTMRPRLTVLAPKGEYGDKKLIGRLTFDYEGKMIGEKENVSLFDAATRKLIQRDAAAEARAAGALDSAGFKFAWGYAGSRQERRLTASKLGRIVNQLCSDGWHVEAEGKLYRQPSHIKIEVSSGIDWFELSGVADFGGGVSAPLPRLLSALRKGEKTVVLDDGTVGILPDEWLNRYGLLARIAKSDDETDEVRFNLRQVGLLDALLSSIPQATFDAKFEAAREELRKFAGVAPIDPPDGFVGTLRPYQRDGLGWLHFLSRFGFGGCLADDMGLGKTVQVLALLESRRQTAGKPSLVVVPKSLIFNWIEEAKRFTPKLRVLDQTGITRAKTAESFDKHDVILTTYGTLRLDAPWLKDFSFDYAILDEAQAIKNASSESAKAARLISADHRLVLSGTPVQNHLGELWSLFEFLNPGMLGVASVFKTTGAGSVKIEQESRELLARALRPFILRRTKEQVAPELPEKTEQTLFCDLDPEQRKLYDELKEHYRASLLERIATEGLNKAKIQVLEALLRLRQAACHPGLIDKSRIKESSAKLDALLPQLAEVIDEGHKVLVFSQFTSMLAIVKHHLDKQQVTYEYLDGQTRDRQARVERFQNDPACKLFLISLKAGGLGLNLTAAEYVFLLDPWWNPAIESQAIDRAHRIGQTRHVFAYRIIARDTVEQKVLELQSRKKELADMIINADNSLISKMGREDLELLLS